MNLPKEGCGARRGTEEICTNRRQSTLGITPTSEQEEMRHTSQFRPLSLPTREDNKRTLENAGKIGKLSSGKIER